MVGARRDSVCCGVLTQERYWWDRRVRRHGIEVMPVDYPLNVTRYVDRHAACSPFEARRRDVERLHDEFWADRGSAGSKRRGTETTLLSRVARPCTDHLQRRMRHDSEPVAGRVWCAWGC
jgi:hypothetical protein